MGFHSGQHPLKIPLIGHARQRPLGPIISSPLTTPTSGTTGGRARTICPSKRVASEIMAVGFMVMENGCRLLVEELGSLGFLSSKVDFVRRLD